MIGNKGDFIGLYDKNKRPIHIGDRYKTLSYQDKPLGGGNPWKEKIEEVKYSFWGDNAGFCLPQNRELI